MKNIEFKLKDINDPFIQGFCSFFMQNFLHSLDVEDSNGNKSLVRDKKVIISDHQKCDIGLMNLDLDIYPPESKIAFCNSKEKYRKNEFYFPYLHNAINEHLQIDEFEKVEYKKEYNCISVFNSNTSQIRIDTVSALKDFCDVVIIDGIDIKNNKKLKKSDYMPCWDLMKKSKFCICPPGHINETYRFYEALRCNCIPLEFNNTCKRLEDFSDEYILNIYGVEDICNFEKIKDLKYSIEELSRVQRNLDRKVLLLYLIEKMSLYNI